MTIDSMGTEPAIEKHSYEYSRNYYAKLDDYYEILNSDLDENQVYACIPQFFFITNEFSPSRLQKLIEYPCIDGVVHIHKRAVLDVCGLDGRLVELIDLVDFIKSSYTW
jgi:hypothetical protein